MKQYEFIEVIIKENFTNEFTITDVYKFITDKKRVTIDRTYISKVLKSLVDKKIVEITRVENPEKGIFATKYHKVIDLQKWNNIFK
jgi:hypothetical protein